MLNLNKHKRGFSCKKQGFSLIELMVALTVLAVAFFGLIRAFPLGINMNISSKNKTVASYLAQEKVERLFSKRYDDIATGTIETKQRISTSTDSYFYPYQRETVVDHIDNDLVSTSSDSGMKRITVTVYYPSGGGRKEGTYQVNTIITKN